MQERQFATGETIFSEGDASSEAYLIRTGRVEVLKDSPHGPLCLAVLGPGDVLGEMGLLDDRPRSATARVAEPVTAAAVERAEFLHLVLERPEEALGLLRAMFERLRTVNQMLADLNIAAAGASKVPTVTLYPLTPETEAVVPAGGLAVTRFPFRIGRVPATREEEALAFNDVSLSDTQFHEVSLNHLALDLGRVDGAAGVVVRDRGSRQGTLVNGQRIGTRGDRDDAPLGAGDNEVVLGAASTLFEGPRSPYRLKVVVASD